MSEVENQPRPISLDQIKQKGDKYRETREIDSDILDVLGDIPAVEKLVALEYGEDETIELRFISSDEGMKLQFWPSGRQGEENLEVPQDVNQAATPVLDMGVDHFRKTFDVPSDTQLKGYCWISKSKIRAEKTPSHILDFPHTDDDLGHPEKHIRYIGAFGPVPAPTDIWKGAFTVVPESLSEEIQEVQLTRQVKERDVPSTSIGESKLGMIDSHCVHASPEVGLSQDSTLVGKERFTISISIELPEVIPQEAA